MVESGREMKPAGGRGVVDVASVLPSVKLCAIFRVFSASDAFVDQENQVVPL